MTTEPTSDAMARTTVKVKVLDMGCILRLKWESVQAPLMSELHLAASCEAVNHKMVWMNFKRVALIAGIGTALSAIGSLLTYRASIRGITATQPSWRWWVTPLMAAVAVLEFMLPLFYFALYGSKATLTFPKWSRTSALLVASALSVVFCAKAVSFAQSRSFPSTSQGLSFFAALCCAVLLLQVSLAKVAENPAPLPKSGSFFALTKAAGLYGGLMIAIFGFRIVATPLAYSVFRDIATRNGHPSPSFAHMLILNIEQFIEVVCLYVTPCLIYMIYRRAERTESGEDAGCQALV